MPSAPAASRAPALARVQDKGQATSVNAAVGAENDYAAAKRAEHELDHQLQGEEAKLDRNISRTQKRMAEALHRKAERIQCSDVASTVQDALSTLQMQNNRSNSIKGRSSVVTTAAPKHAAEQSPSEDGNKSACASSTDQQATPTSGSKGCGFIVPGAAAVPPQPAPQRDLSTMGSRKATRQSSLSSNKSASSIAAQQQASMNACESTSSTPAASQPSSQRSSRAPSRQEMPLDNSQSHCQTYPTDVWDTDVDAPVQAQLDAATAAATDAVGIPASNAVQHSPKLKSSGMLLLQAGSGGSSSKTQAAHVGHSRSTQLVSSRTTGSGRLVPSSSLVNCMVCLDVPMKQTGQSSDVGWLQDTVQADTQLPAQESAISGAPIPLPPVPLGAAVSLQTEQSVADEGTGATGSEAKVVVAAGVGWGLGPKGAGSTSASLHQPATTSSNQLGTPGAATAAKSEAHSNNAVAAHEDTNRTGVSEVQSDRKALCSAAGSLGKKACTANSSCTGPSRKSHHCSVRPVCRTGSVGTDRAKHERPPMPTNIKDTKTNTAQHVDCGTRCTSQVPLRAAQQQARGSAAAAAVEPNIKLKQQIWRMRRAFGLEQAVIKDSCAHVQEFGAGAWQ